MMLKISWFCSICAAVAMATLALNFAIKEQPIVAACAFVGAILLGIVSLHMHDEISKKQS